MALYFSSLECERPKYLGGGKWKLQGLNEITILFGKNGSGKSLILRALHKEDPNNFHYSSPERAGDINPDVGIMQDDINPTRRTTRRAHNFAVQFRQEAVSRVQSVITKVGHKSRLPERPESDAEVLNDIVSLVNFLLPEFDFQIVENERHSSFKRRHNNRDVSNVNELSSGEAETYTLALDLLTICSLWKLDQQEKRILLVDEPDTHLHPDLQQHLGLFLTKLVECFGVQIILATHSTTFLSALGLHGSEKTSTIYLNNSTEEQPAKKFDSILMELSACLGGHALMGPLFGAPLLLVEGDDDYKIWSHVPRFHQVNLAVIPCAGVDEVKKYQKTLEQIFDCIRDEKNKPVGFALFDGDQNLPSENSHPQNNIRFIKLACHESENLYLADEVLSLLETDWESAKEKIKSESDGYGEQAAKLKTCDTWDRKNEDLKDVIEHLVSILDPKQVPWTFRVAKCIGAGRPAGQVAKFLGEDLIVALWGPAPEETAEQQENSNEPSQD